MDMQNIFELIAESETKASVVSINEYKDCTQQSGSCFSIVHLNIRSLKKNFNELLIFLETLSDVGVDILILSETWNIEDLTIYNIEGYQIFYNDSKLNKNDGMVMYVANKIVTKFSNLKYQNFTFSRISFKFGNKEFAINCTYRPPSTDVNQFLECLDSYLQDHIDRNTTEAFVGDININILQATELSTSYLNSLASFGFGMCIDRPTRKVGISSTCIDHIFLKESPNTTSRCSAYVLETTITDHYAVGLNIFIVDQSKNLNTHRTIKKINYDKLFNILNNITWEEVTSLNDSELANNKFISILQRTIEKSTIEIKINKHHKKLKPWITNAIINSIKHRDLLKKHLNNNINNNNLKIQYKTYRNKLNKTIEKAKNNYYKQKLAENKSSPKKVWALIKDATNFRKKIKKPINIKNENDEIETDNSKKANIFNEYFRNIGGALANKIDNTNNNLDLPQKNVTQTIFLNPVNEEEIILTISSLKNNCSPGSDNINVELIKKIHIFIIKPIQHIINLIFSTGIVPTHYKQSVITPLFKNGNAGEINNYRPITLINNIAKIFEKCFKKRIVGFLENHGLLSHCQFGFREKKNTEMAIYELVEHVNNCFDQNKKCVAVFLDLAKAFDTVSHTILLDRVEELGLRGLTLQIIKNYLSERKQFVNVDGCMSEALITETGVPQGTVLGPVLFLIYINNLFYQNVNAKFISYADDTVILFEDAEWGAVATKAEVGLSRVRMYMDKSLLTLNYSKTKFIAFSTTNAAACNTQLLKLHSNLCMTNNNTKCECGMTIGRVKSLKYLGVIVDEHLRWRMHAEFISKKIRAIIPVFYQLRNILSTTQLIATYKSLIEPILRYGVINWGGLCRINLNIIQITQNFVLKVMLKKEKRFPTEQLYLESNLSNVKLLYILQSIVYTHSTFADNRLAHQYSTRAVSSQHITNHFYRKSHCQRFIAFNGPKYYNLLPTKIRNITKKHIFIRETKKYITANKLLFLR